MKTTDLLEALKTIARGDIDKFPDAPSLELPPLEFRSKMWVWSQKVAKAAIDSFATKAAAEVVEKEEVATEDDVVMVLRVVQYEGPRKDVETQIERSLHGSNFGVGKCKITATTIGEFPVSLPLVAADKRWNQNSA